MKVIRDEIYLFMIPILQKYGIKRCNVKGCDNKPTTIVTECEDSDGDRLDFALCESHYQESKEKGEISFSLEFHENKAKP